MARRHTAILALLTALPLLACATVPKLPQAAAVRPADSYDTGRLGAGSATWPEDRWWASYADPQLNALIEEGLAGSPSYAAAVARVGRAEALAEQAGASRLPEISADASVAAAKQSYNLGIPPLFVPRGYHSNTRATLGLSWDLDLWGRNRDALAAARGEALAARADAAEARRVLTTGIASAYADLARLYEDRDAAVAIVGLRRQSQELIALRLRNGLETRGSLRQNQSVESAANADVIAIDESIAIARNRLAALVGAGPGRGERIARPTLAMANAPNTPNSLALDLIGRRPDIVAARLRVEAAERRTSAARKDFYPNINLTGFIGFQSLDLGNLLKSGSDIGSIGPALHLPIFTNGRLEGAYRANRADHDAAVANYDQALTIALQEVADAMAGLHTVEARITQTTAALKAAEDAYAIALDRYDAGLSPYLAVLQSEDAVVANRRALADLRSRSVSLDIQLIRALGGGYREVPTTLAGLPANSANH